MSCGTKISDFFSPKRGIRHRVTISPYLFVLCMDRLTHMIAEQVELRSCEPIKADRNGPHVSHLMFSNDLLLFAKATERNMHCVANTLNTFYGIWG